jgi:hypothetical protein
MQVTSFLPSIKKNSIGIFLPIYYYFKRAI